MSMLPSMMSVWERRWGRVGASIVLTTFLNHSHNIHIVGIPHNFLWLICEVHAHNMPHLHAYFTFYIKGRGFGFNVPKRIWRQIRSLYHKIFIQNYIDYIIDYIRFNIAIPSPIPHPCYPETMAFRRAFAHLWHPTESSHW